MVTEKLWNKGVIYEKQDFLCPFRANLAKENLNYLLKITKTPRG